VVSLLCVAMLGLPFLRYAAYVLPLFAYFIWCISEPRAIKIDRHTAPFVLLLGVSLISVFDADFNGVKRLVFVGVYTSLFVLFQFRRAKFDIRYLNVAFIAVFILSSGILYGTSGRFTQFTYSIVDSQASFESSLSFPLGMFSLFFLIRGRHLWCLINVLLAVITLKRIVLVAIAVSVLIWLIPRRMRGLILNPYVATVITMACLIVTVQFGQGTFDSWISDTLGVASNDLTKGRRVLWGGLMQSINFSYDDFVLYGIGLGKSVSELQVLLHRERVLLHSDLLTILIEFGFFSVLVFTFLLNAQRSLEERILAAYLSILFLTDNVLIYQHVMLPFLIMMTALGRDNEIPGAQATPSLSEPLIAPESTLVSIHEKTNTLTEPAAEDAKVGQ
jgi:hypothetical protein